MVRVIMLSPPGAGKGTHSRWLNQQTGAAHISSGDLLRAEVARGSRLGRRVAAYTARGDLVPDELIFSILVPAIVAAVRDTGGYVLDGFPRTMPQALRAAELGSELALTANAVIYLTAPEEELVSRLLDRADRDGRADDRLAVIRHRLAIFARETAPLVDYYRSRGILLELSTDRPETDVRADLRHWLEARGLMPAVADPAPLRILSPNGRWCVSPADGRAGQFRPAMTPPSTSQMAPVTQLMAGESRKVMALASGVPVPAARVAPAAPVVPVSTPGNPGPYFRRANLGAANGGPGPGRALFWS
jgi:adenylate kinase